MSIKSEYAFSHHSQIHELGIKRMDKGNGHVQGVQESSTAPRGYETPPTPLPTEG